MITTIPKPKIIAATAIRSLGVGDGVGIVNLKNKAPTSLGAYCTVFLSTTESSRSAISLYVPAS
jgi:hypothetical protein